MNALRCDLTVSERLENIDRSFRIMRPNITLTSSGLFINDIQSIEYLIQDKSAINKKFMFKICILQTGIENSMSTLTIYKY